MKTCSYCGKEYPDAATVCAIDATPLEGGTTAGDKLSEVSLYAEDKEWIEASLGWLLKEFGEDGFLKRKLILPEPLFFPDKFYGTEECVIKMVERVCSYMNVDAASVDVRFLMDRDDTAAKHRTGREDDYSGAAGLYFPVDTPQSRQRIAINVSQFKNPTALVGTIAHELGHVILLGGGKIVRDDEGTHEYLTDLLTVFFGLGIFTANSAFQFNQWQDHSHQGWSAARMGYMSEEMFAYSLAAYAWMRGDLKPRWAHYLAINVGHYFRQDLKYLANGGHTSLRQLA